MDSGCGGSRRNLVPTIRVLAVSRRVKGKVKRMQKKHWQWLGFFVAGTFLGGYVLSLGARVLSKVQ